MAKRSTHSKVAASTPGATGDSPRRTQAGEFIFGDKRSGRDRRENEDPEQAKQHKRASSDRRRGAVKEGAWWLERSYVESHHFVQKSTSGRSAPTVDREGKDED